MLQVKSGLRLDQLCNLGNPSTKITPTQSLYNHHMIGYIHVSVLGVTVSFVLGSGLVYLDGILGRHLTYMYIEY